MVARLQPDSTPSTILRRVRGAGRGSVFVPTDFLDLGTRAAVDAALSRLSRQGKLRRLARGVYDYPQTHPRLGPLSPDPRVLARALARATDGAVYSTGASAANELGLSTQVPAQAVFLTDGASRSVRAGAWTIQLQHATPGGLLGGDSLSGLTVRALRHIGAAQVTDAMVDHLRRILTDSDKRTLAALAHRVPGWMRPLLDRIVRKDPARVA